MDAKTFSEHIRRAIAYTRGQLCIAVDLPGRRPFVTATVTLERDHILRVGPAASECDIRVTDFALLATAKEGSILAAAEGRIALEVLKHTSQCLEVRVLGAGDLAIGRSVERSDASVLGVDLASEDCTLAALLAAECPLACIWLSNASVRTLTELTELVAPVSVWPKVERDHSPVALQQMATMAGTVVVGRQDLTAVAGISAARIEQVIVSSAKAVSASVILGSASGTALQHDPPYSADELMLLSYSTRESGTSLLLSETCVTATPGEVAQRWHGLHRE